VIGPGAAWGRAGRQAADEATGAKIRWKVGAPLGLIARFLRPLLSSLLQAVRRSAISGEMPDRAFLASPSAASSAPRLPLAASPGAARCAASSCCR
jgi:hypothetical protein